jgi:hypothetical protein
MLRVAQQGLSVTDAISGSTHKATGYDAENIFFRRCRVALKSAVNIFHSRGFAVGYRVFQEEELGPSSDTVSVTSEADSIVAPRSEASVSTQHSVSLGMSKAATIRSRSSTAGTSTRAKPLAANSSRISSTQKSIRAMEQAQYLRQR